MATHAELTLEFLALPKDINTWTVFDYNLALELKNHFAENFKIKKEVLENQYNVIEDGREKLKKLKKEDAQRKKSDERIVEQCVEFEGTVADLQEEKKAVAQHHTDNLQKIEEVRAAAELLRKQFLILENTVEKEKGTRKIVKKSKIPIVKPHVCCICKLDKLKPPQKIKEEENDRNLEADKLLSDFLLEVENHEMQVKLNKREIFDYVDQIDSLDYQNQQIKRELCRMDSIEKLRVKNFEETNSSEKNCSENCSKCQNL